MKQGSGHDRTFSFYSGQLRSLQEALWKGQGRGEGEIPSSTNRRQGSVLREDGKVQVQQEFTGGGLLVSRRYCRHQGLKSIPALISSVALQSTLEPFARCNTSLVKLVRLEKGRCEAVCQQLQMLLALPRH